MKYCHNCKIYRSGESKFCTRCGSSFDVKYCRKLHLNTVTAEYCSVCGSSDLSTPHKPSSRQTVAVLTAAGVGIAAAVIVLASVLQSLFIEGSDFFGEMLIVAICSAMATVCWSGWKNRRR